MKIEDEATMSTKNPEEVKEPVDIKIPEFLNNREKEVEYESSTTLPSLRYIHNVSGKEHWMVLMELDRLIGKLVSSPDEPSSCNIKYQIREDSINGMQKTKGCISTDKMDRFFVTER